MERRYAPENTPRDEEMLLAPSSQENVPPNMEIAAPMSGATLKERLAAGMAAMEKVSDKRKRPADHSIQAATPAKQIRKPLQYHPRVGGAQGGQPGADVPAQPPVAAQSNPDIALRSALRQLRGNMLHIADTQVATPDEVRSMLKELQEVRGLLSTRTPLRNSIEAFVDLMEASLRAKMPIR